MSKFAIIGAALLAVPAPVFAQIIFVDDLSKFTPTQSNKVKSDLDKVQCRSEDVLGSRLERHQVCLTKEQWYLYEQEAKQRVREWEVIPLTSH